MKIDEKKEALEDEILFKSALKRIEKNPEEFGAISIEDAIAKGIISKNEKLNIDKSALAEAEILWRAEEGK